MESRRETYLVRLGRPADRFIAEVRPLSGNVSRYFKSISDLAHYFENLSIESGAGNRAAEGRGVGQGVDEIEPAAGSRVAEGQGAGQGEREPEGDTE